MTLDWDFVGRLLKFQVGLIFEQKQEDVKCFCDEMHVGESCEFGVCPEGIEGDICSGHGNKFLGFGYEKETSVKKDGCTLICQSPNCQSSQTCPSERPYRCATGECVRNGNGGEEYGVWDNLTTIPDGMQCNNIVSKVVLERKTMQSDVLVGVWRFIEILLLLPM